VYNGIYPVRINPYTPPVKQKQNEENTPEAKQSQTSEKDKDSFQGQSGYGYGRQSVIDYTSTTVNISQILIDFQNTLNAIGAPKEVEEEVKTYLELVNRQSTKEKPSRSIITSNLKNAATILDGYIAEALKKPSNVVQGWVDALLLQKVDYKANPELAQKVETNLKETKSEPVTQNSQETQTVKEKQPEAQNTVFVPENKDLKKIYLSAQKYTEIGEHEKALSAYAKAINYAKKINDKDTQANIYLNVAGIQDDNNKIVEALKCYNNAIKLSSETGNTITQAKAHYGMALIYDEIGNYDAAMGHYFAALSLDGENENLRSQALTLNDVGNMHVLRYEYENALDYYKEGLALAKEVPDAGIMGTILGNTAGLFRNAGDDKKALKYYRDSIKCDRKAGKTLDCSKSFEQAGDIMLKLGNYSKAQSLYNKSLKIAFKENDTETVKRLSEKLKQRKVS